MYSTGGTMGFTAGGSTTDAERIFTPKLPPLEELPETPFNELISGFASNADPRAVDFLTEVRQSIRENTPVEIKKYAHIRY